MVRTRMPLLSAEARGTIGDLLTFQGTPKGTKAYKYTNHADAESSTQLIQRARYSEATVIWGLLTIAQKEYFEELGGGKYTSQYHAFMSWYISKSVINPILFLWDGLTWQDRQWITNG